MNHINRFIDRRWYPDFQPTDDLVELLYTYQTYGKKKLTEEQLKLLEPLKNGQQMKELTLRMNVEEMSYWWSQGWGWIYPINNNIEWVTKEKPIDRIWLLALLRIRKKCLEGGFMEFMLSFTGMDDSLKQRHLKTRFSVW